MAQIAILGWWAGVLILYARYRHFIAEEAVKELNETDQGTVSEQLETTQGGDSAALF